MNPRIRTVSIALMTGIALSQFVASLSAQAQPQKQRSETSNTSKTARENHTSTVATNSQVISNPKSSPEFKICNFTQDTVNYDINGATRILPSTACEVWKIKGQALLSFDKLFSAGYQKKTYEISGGQYIFQGYRWSNEKEDSVNPVDGLNLFKFLSPSS